MIFPAGKNQTKRNTPMKKITLPQDKNPSGISARSALDEILREGARKMLQEAIEDEVDL